MNDRLYRSRDERIILGVAGGVAEHFDLDPSLVRVLWAILIVLTGGIALLLYILMAFVVPEEPAGDARWDRWSAASSRWPDTTTGPTSETVPSADMPPTASAPFPNPTRDALVDATPGMPGTAATATAGSVTPTTVGGGAGSTEPISPTDRIPLPSGFSDTRVGLGGTPSPPSFGRTPADAREAAKAARADARDQRRQARQERREWRRQHGDPTGALIFGLILILVGGFFFVRSFLPSIDVGQVWPIILVIVGAALLLGSIRRSSGSSM